MRPKSILLAWNGVLPSLAGGNGWGGPWFLPWRKLGRAASARHLPASSTLGTCKSVHVFNVKQDRSQESHHNEETWPRSSPSSIRGPETDMPRPGIEKRAFQTALTIRNIYIWARDQGECSLPPMMLTIPVPAQEREERARKLKAKQVSKKPDPIGEIVMLSRNTNLTFILQNLFFCPWDQNFFY